MHTVGGVCDGSCTQQTEPWPTLCKRESCSGCTACTTFVASRVPSVLPTQLTVLLTVLPTAAAMLEPGETHVPTTIKPTMAPTLCMPDSNPQCSLWARLGECSAVGMHVCTQSHTPGIGCKHARKQHAHRHMQQVRAHACMHARTSTSTHASTRACMRARRQTRPADMQTQVHAHMCAEHAHIHAYPPSCTHKGRADMCVRTRARTHARTHARNAHMHACSLALTRARRLAFMHTHARTHAQPGGYVLTNCPTSCGANCLTPATTAPSSTVLPTTAPTATAAAGGCARDKTCFVGEYSCESCCSKAVSTSGRPCWDGWGGQFSHERCCNWPKPSTSPIAEEEGCVRDDKCFDSKWTCESCCTKV